MKGEVIAKTNTGRYIIKPTDSNNFELVPFEKFHKCVFPCEILDKDGLLRDGAIIELVRVSNGWIYPNHKIYRPAII